MNTIVVLILTVLIVVILVLLFVMPSQLKKPFPPNVNELGGKSKEYLEGYSAGKSRGYSEAENDRMPM